MKHYFWVIIISSYAGFLCAGRPQLMEPEEVQQIYSKQYHECVILNKIENDTGIPYEQKMRNILLRLPALLREIEYLEANRRCNRDSTISKKT